MSYDSNKIGRPKIKKGFVRNANWNLIGLISVWFIALLITGLNELIRAGFDPDIIFTPTWWYNIFRTLITNMIVFFGTWYYLLNEFLDKSEEYEEEKKSVDKIVKEHLDPITFDVFLPWFNRKRKKNAYKKNLVILHNKIDEKISKKPKVLDLWAQHLKDESGQHWKKHKLTKKKFYLLEQMKEEYIEDNIDSVNVPYKPLTKKFVTNGYVHTDPNQDDYDVQSSSDKLLRDLLPRFMFTLTLLVGINSIFIEALVEENRMVAFFVFILNALPLLLQIIMATNYRDKFVNEKIFVDFRTRKDVMINYLDYLKRKEGNNG